MAHRSLGLPPAAPRLRLSARLGARARGRAAPWLAGQLLAERERWLLWLPVALGLGIGLYFALPLEPPLWLGPALLLVARPGLVWAWRWPESGVAPARPRSPSGRSPPA